MIMTIENKRRELFEAWFERLNHRKPDIRYDRAGHYYSERDVDAAWCGFNAALDSVVIQLPPAWKSSGSTHELMHKRDTIAAIESTGLGLKVLP